MQTRNGLMLLTTGLLLSALALAAEADQPAKPAQIGQPAPTFELKGIDGKTYKLDDYADKVVVLEWFNMECPVCRGASELSAATSKKYAEKGVVWLAIDSTYAKHPQYRDAATISKYAAEHKLQFPILKDEDNSVADAYGAKTTPHMYIVNKGTLVYKGGFDNGRGAKADGERNYVAESLDALLAGKDVPSPETKNRGCSIKRKK